MNEIMTDCFSHRILGLINAKPLTHMNKLDLIMDKLGYFLVLGVLVMGSCKYIDPCYSKASFLSQIEETVDEVKENGANYSESDWKVMDDRVESLMDNCYEKYKEELTKEEKQKIAIYATSYVYERHKSKLSDFVDTIEDMKLDQKAVEFISQADEQIKALFNDVLKDDFEKVVDTAVDEFEKLARELKEKWEESKN